MKIINLKSLQLCFLVLLMLTTTASNAQIMVGQGHTCDVPTLNAGVALARIRGIQTILVTNEIEYSYNGVLASSYEIIGGFNNCPDAKYRKLSNQRTVLTVPNNINRTVLKIHTDLNNPLSNIIIKNFKITGGFNRNANQAGGVQISGNSSVEFINSVINKNKGNKGGGISIKNNTAQLTLNDTIIYKNKAINNGGGISCSDGAEVKILGESAVSFNRATQGGGIYTSECNITSKSGDTKSLGKMKQGIFNNIAKISGGGIYSDNSIIVLRGNLNHPSSVSANQTINNTIDHTYGAGIYALDSDISATNTRLDLNFSLNVTGAAIYTHNSIFEMNTLNQECWAGNRCSSISDNHVANIGAGAAGYFSASTVNIARTHISRNYSNSVTTFYLRGTKMTLEGSLLDHNYNPISNSSPRLIVLDGPEGNNSELLFQYNTVADNRVENIFFLSATQSTQRLSVLSSIIWGNDEAQNNEILFFHNEDLFLPHAKFDCVIVYEKNSIRDFSHPTAIKRSNPLFVDEANSDYHLLEGSPAIDYCDQTFANARFSDLDQNPRGINSLNIQDYFGLFDLGAYEYQD